MIVEGYDFFLSFGVIKRILVKNERQVGITFASCYWAQDRIREREIQEKSFSPSE